MRYLGSKKKLLDAIVSLARERGLGEGDTVLDIFSGTAVVGRRFKEAGARVVSNDRMRLSWVLQRALIVADEVPADLGDRVAALEAATPTDGLIARQYSPAGSQGRGFFTAENARRIDGALRKLMGWSRRNEVCADTFYVLLAGILEGASSVANISGTYGAFLKSWQRNAQAPFRVRVQPVVRGRAGRCEAHRRDGNRLVAEIDADLLYIDPPYNGREYSANYHVLEAIAERPFLVGRRLAAFEASIYGKTGLLPYERSHYCSTRKVLAAFTELIQRARCPRVILSYNEEGLLKREQIVGALARGLGCRGSAVALREVDYRRFRSDADRTGDGTKGSRRRYKKRAGRSMNGVREWLFYAARPEAAHKIGARRRSRAAEAELSGAGTVCGRGA